MKNKPIPESEWRWFGNAGHFIGGNSCRFHLCTQVGNYLVSTVGQLWWGNRQVQEIHAQCHDPEWLKENKSLMGDFWDAAYMKKFGYEKLGLSRTFETMVFECGKPCTQPECHCGMPEISGSELDFEGYNTAGAATIGHFKLCKKWARKK